jgi:hypothetical protein
LFSTGYELPNLRLLCFDNDATVPGGGYTPSLRRPRVLLEVGSTGGRSNEESAGLTTTEGIRKVGVILYGLVAAFAGFTVAGLGPIALAFFGVWIFGLVGWEQASNWAARFGFYYIYFFVVGLLVGTVICLRVWINGFRNASTTSSLGTK